MIAVGVDLGPWSRRGLARGPGGRRAARARIGAVGGGRCCSSTVLSRYHDADRNLSRGLAVAWVGGASRQCNVVGFEYKAYRGKGLVTQEKRQRLGNSSHRSGHGGSRRGPFEGELVRVWGPETGRIDKTCLGAS